MSDQIAGFRPLEVEDLKDPGRINAELRFMYERLNSIEGSDKRYTFRKEFNATQINLRQDRKPESDTELITYGAAKNLFGPQACETTGISWCRSSFNSWWGCSKPLIETPDGKTIVSPECVRCYAERDSIRYGFKIWGENAPRRFFSDKHWAEQRLRK